MVNLVRHDLEFILKQIKIAEASSEAHSGLNAKPLGEIRIDETGNISSDPADLLAIPTNLSPYGLRTVDGSYNNLVADRDSWGASDTPFEQITDPYWRNEGDDAFPYVPGNNNNYGQGGSVVDADPRTISNLVIDQSLDNPAAIYAALTYAGMTGSALLPTVKAIGDAKKALDLAIKNAQVVGGDIPALEQALADAMAAAAQAQTDALSAQAAAIVDEAEYQAALSTASAAETEADEALADLTAFLVDGVVPDADQVGYNEALALFLIKQQAFAEAEALATTRGQEAASSAQAAAAAAGAALTAAAAVTTAQQALEQAQTVDGNADAEVALKEAALNALLEQHGVEVENGSVVLPNVAPDEGLSAPYNSWFTLFGQFFDHGLDLVPKGGNGTVYIPLQPDDPLYNPASPQTNFMVLTRAPADPTKMVNLTTPWVDQNQTYSSHASKQLFMREYAMVDGEPLATGRLLGGEDGHGLATWADVKKQARDVLGIELTDADVTNIPMFVMDEYGEFVRGPNGFPQMLTSLGTDGKFGGGDDVFVEGNPAAPISTVGAVRTGHAFLDDIAHSAAPGLVDHDRNPATAKIAMTADADDVAGNLIIPNQFGASTVYDNELLDAHYITGDGRGNENIGLTAVHHVFHSEHNHTVDQVKTRAIESGDISFLNEWLRVDLPAGTVLPDPADTAAVKAFADTLSWDGERLFQAARFSTEMQYQHLVFEEFARKIQPDVDAFVFQPSMDINPAIFAEFAHVVYRFGHSMLRETVDQIDNNGSLNPMKLFDAFLNPLAFGSDTVSHDQAAGAIVRGMTSQVGSEIDEFVTGVLRNQLLGIPLDLAALNIARGRDTGIPPLNEARRQFREIASGDTQLDPYTSWTDFMLNLKNPASIVNLIAAYGTHQSIIDAGTAAAKRDAAWKLVFGGQGAPADRLDFLNATGSYTGGKLGGLEDVDLWVGGMAEKKMAFGGMLGSTFSFVFELQLENLQNADRFYYLSRVQGLNFLNELENNSFAKMVLNNTDLAETGYAVPGDIFSVPDHVIYVDANQQAKFGHADAVQDEEWRQELTPFVERRDATGKLIEYQKNPDGTFARDANGNVIPVDPSQSAVANYVRVNTNDHVLIQGTNGNDHIVAGGGDDSVWGRDGDDKIEAGYGVDKIHGGKGDDIITNSGTDIGEVDMLHGEEGNDVIHGGSGLALVFGNEGSDFIMAGPDGKEVFGGTGNDFILGGDGGDFLLGNEGDDWIEAGNGFDTTAGDNSDLNFNSSILGHDVMFAGQNEHDFDAESGDDIMVQGESVMRNEGMFGYDWAIHKFNNEAADSDLLTPIFTTDEEDILRDRFDQVEALSGWDKNDVLRGDNRGDPNAETPPPGANGDAVETVFTNNELSQAGVNRIAGLRDLLGDMVEAAPTSGDLEKVVAFDRGNILIGGGGSDLIEGRGGDDVIDGDAWLNVRIGIKDANGNLIGSAEAMGGPAKDLNGLAMYGGRPLHDLMLDRTLNPGQLTIIREILATSNAGDVDTAVYSGNREDYTVIQLDADSVRIVDNRGIDTSDIGDRVHRIEQFQFADGTISFAELVNSAPEITNNGGNALTVSVNENSSVDTLVVDIDAADVNAGDTLTYSISGGNQSGLFAINPATGRISLTAVPDYETLLALGQASQNLTVAVSDGFATDSIDITVNIANLPELVVTGPVILAASNEDVVRTITLAELLANASLDGSTAGLTVSSISVPAGKGVIYDNGDGTFDYIPAENDASDVTISFTINGDGASVATSATLDLVGFPFNVNGTGNLNGADINRAEQFHGGAGSDTITPYGGNDTIFGGAGNDTVVGNDPFFGSDRGAGNDTIVAVNNDGNDTYNGGSGTDTYDLQRVTAAVTVNLSNGTTSGGAGTDNLSSIENVIGGRGNDTITGNGGANLLRGHVGNDSILGGGGDDTIFGDVGNDTIVGSTGSDTVDGGAGDDTFTWSATSNLFGDTSTDGRDVVNGGAEGTTGDTFVINGANRSETFRIYTNAEAVTAGLINNANTAEIIITRTTQGIFGSSTSIIAELTEIEEIRVNTQLVTSPAGTPPGGSTTNSGDTIEVIGDFTGTSLNFNTITIDGNSGDDTVDISSLQSAHRIVFKTNGGNDTIIGTLREQDVIELAPGLTLNDYTKIVNENGTVTWKSATHSVTYMSDGSPALKEHEDEDDDNPEGNEKPVVEDESFTIKKGEVLSLTAAQLLANDLDLDGGELSIGGLDEDEHGTAVLNSDGTITFTPKAGFTGEASFTYMVSDGQGGYTEGKVTITVEKPAPVVSNPVPAAEAPAPMSVNGGRGNDRLYGDEANDRLKGGSGHDRLDGGAGSDRMWGGRGNDTYTVDDRSDRVYESKNQGIDTVKASVSYSLAGTHVEKLVLTGSADLNATGNSLNNSLIGNSGNNVLKGGGGQDTLKGMAGNDKLYGGSGHDKLEGGRGDDQLYGGTGNDRLNGGSGDDRVDGGGGNNRLTGGSGDDIFVFNKQHGMDTVTDFRAGHDRVDVSGLSGVDNMSDLYMWQSGSSTVIWHHSAVLVLNGVKESDLDSSDFIF